MNIMMVPTWAEFKAVCVSKKNLNLQYSDDGNRYTIYGPDSATLLWQFNIVKTDPKSADQIDFEDNYKDSSNYAIGNRNDPFATDDYVCRFDGIAPTLVDCIPTSYKDLLYKVLEDDIYVNGGEIIQDASGSNGITLGDYITMAITDEDNILDYGAGFVVKQWIDKHYLSPSEGVQKIKVPYAGQPPKGLYVRIRYYRATDSTMQPRVAINLYLHRSDA